MNMHNVKFIRTVLWGLLIISLYRLFTASSVFSVTGLHFTVLSALFSFVVSLLGEKRKSVLRFNFLTSSILISISILIVHFFDYWQYSLGLSDNLHGIEYIGYEIINRASLCALCIYISFLIGGTYGNKIFKERHATEQLKVSSRTLEILLLASVVSFYLFTDKYFFNGGYGEIMNTVGLPPISQISLTLIQSFQLAISVILIYNKPACSFSTYLKYYSPVYYLAMLIFYFLIVSAGERGFLVYTGVVFLVTYYVINHKTIKLKTVLVLGIVAVVLLNVLGVLRSMDGSLSADKMKQAYAINEERNSENAFFSSTHELSDVVQTYHVTYNFVEQVSIIYGVGLIDQCLGIIPGLRFFLYPLLGIDQTQISTTALSTRILNKDVGMGTTCIADTYFNLGFWGSLVLFFILGLLLKRMDRSLYSSRPNFIVLIFAIQYISYGIYIGRSTLFIPFNSCAYAILIIYLCTIFSKKKA